MVKDNIPDYYLILMAKIFFTCFLNIMIRPKNKELFCEQYWKRVMKKTKPKAAYDTKVSTDFDLYSVNNFFMDVNPEAKETLETNIDMPLSKFISVTDKEFKKLPPTKKDLVLWRGIEEPSKDSKYRHALFERAYNCKKGDVITMPIYAYASNEIRTALSFAEVKANKKSIVYEIQVPQDSRVNKYGFYNFPRCSRFECLDNKDIASDNGAYKQISLKYIQPKEIKLNKVDKIINFVKGFLDLFTQA